MNSIEDFVGLAVLNKMSIDELLIFTEDQNLIIEDGAITGIERKEN